MQLSARANAGVGSAAVAALALVGCAPEPEMSRLPAADPARGRELVRAVGCGACHTIPGVSWPRGTVAPSLEGFGDRTLIAGRFANEPETLTLWVRDAPALIPETGMTPMPLDEQEARDVAAYLYTLSAR